MGEIEEIGNNELKDVSGGCIVRGLKPVSYTVYCKTCDLTWKVYRIDERFPDTTCQKCGSKDSVEVKNDSKKQQIKNKDD